tara:strand:- start:4097 stop:5380 length:1284 start_codon:yes stop_codon:yes gene_type:complete
MTSKPFNIIVSAYACGPNWGSEIGMGWNWVIHLSKHCQLHVITEAGFKEEIEKKLQELNLDYPPIFYYNCIGNKGRKLFWKQGSFLFYYYYRKWQQNTYKIAKEIIETNDIDLVHQLNMIGFREPGYLWKIKEKPYVWGPVGGYDQMPLSYIFSLKKQDILFYGLKNVINFFQKNLSIRVKKSARAASVLVASTAKAKFEIDKLSSKKAYLMGETGCNPIDFEIQKAIKKIQTIKILWVGRLQALKSLPIALKALSKLKYELDFELIIIGDGPDEKSNKALAQKLNLEENCKWIGRIPNEEVIAYVRSSTIFLFTSLKEGTPHVIMEAIQNGLPVICHDACGHGAIIDDSCGLKIPMINEKLSIELFSKAILKLANDRELQARLSIGAIKKSNEVTWEAKASEMVSLYKTIFEEKNIKNLNKKNLHL